MKLQIEIPDEIYEYTQNEKYDEHLERRFDFQTRYAVKNGKPLTDSLDLPDATNGDVIKFLFPNIDSSISGDGDVVDVYNLGIYCQTFDIEWWNAPYKESEGK